MVLMVLMAELAGKGEEGKVMGGWTKLHNFYPLLNGMRVVKSNQVKWAVHVETNGVSRKVYTFYNILLSCPSVTTESCLVYLKVICYMFRLGKEPSSGQLHSLNQAYNGVCAHYGIPCCITTY
jgi:hypothetical protein